mgnify:CR=1 FL=1|jgi:hypothetical protein
MIQSEGFVFGASITLVMSVIINLMISSGRPNSDDIYRSGYAAALNDVTRRMMDAKGQGWKRTDLRSSYETFIEPQYKKKMIDCPYNLPW